MTRLVWWWRHARARSRRHWAERDYERWPSPANQNRLDWARWQVERLEAGRP